MSIENPRQEASEPRMPELPADQPDGIADDSYDLPDTSRAAARVNEFLAWYGDGRLYPCVLPGTEDEMPPLFARDLQALTNAALAAPDGAVKLGDVEALREGCGADGCTSFGGCAVCGSEAEFEADPEAHIAANDALLAGHVVEHQPPSAAEGAA